VLRQPPPARSRLLPGRLAPATLAVLLAGCGGEMARTARTVTSTPAAAGPTRAAPAGRSEAVRACGSRVEGLPGALAASAIAVSGIRFAGLREAAGLRASDLAALHNRYLAYKAVTEVDAGRDMTVAVAPASRTYARLLYDPRSFRDDGRYLLADGELRVRFSSCAASQPRRSGGGAVGARTQFNGGFVVAGRRCVSLLIASNANPRPARISIPFGRRRCG
jgi:hypothetical protein